VSEAAQDPAEERLVEALRLLADVELELENERLQRMSVAGMFEEVLGAMSDCLILVEPRGRVWRVNKAAADLLRRTTEEMVGKPLQDVLGPGVPASTWQIFQRDPRGRLEAVETFVLRADGEKVPVSLSCAVITDPDGKVVGAVYAARDLSQTHRLLHELEKAESRWRLLTEVGDLLGGELDPRDALPAVCERLGEATGCRAALILVREATFVEDVVVGSDVDAPVSELVNHPLPVGTALARVVRGGRVVHAPTLQPDFPLVIPGWPARSAALAPLMARSTSLGALLLFSEQPGAVGDSAVGLMEPVAARVSLALANARLRESLVELEAAREAAQSRQDVISGLSHDMKTPLGVISGLIEGLREDGSPEERDRMYTAMRRQVQRLSSLVQQFLDYSRLEGGHRLVAHLQPTDLAELIDRAVATWGRNHPIEVDLEAGLPWAFADSERLEQVLANLLSNAVKFSPPNSPVAITARRVRKAIDIRVTDRGKGITPADLANLFEKFHRGAGARGTEGAGLGLYISKALIEAQGGAIAVTSRVGSGSTFTVTLPCAPPDGPRREG
jgi:PAS domain S-box-containing protein